LCGFCSTCSTIHNHSWKCEVLRQDFLSYACPLLPFVLQRAILFKPMTSMHPLYPVKNTSITQQYAPSLLEELSYWHHARYIAHQSTLCQANYVQVLRFPLRILSKSLKHKPNKDAVAPFAETESHKTKDELATAPCLLPLLFLPLLVCTACFFLARCMTSIPYHHPSPLIVHIEATL